MTGPGTNTWIVGRGTVAVIDPGPAHDRHLAAILSALRPGESVGAIIVTHAHLDHSELAPALSAATGAKVHAFGDASAGRNPALVGLSEIGGGEGVDTSFQPDIETSDGAIIPFGDSRFEVLHTPGHFGNHICLRWGNDLFSGDHVMGWASSMVSPPDGCMTAYMNSLERLVATGPKRIFAGHGPVIEDGRARLLELLAHRRQRESEILARLVSVEASPREITESLYQNVDPALHGAARRNVLAHLIDLESRGRVRVSGPHGLDAHYVLSDARG
jgi:hydroxyacylglutathione hydrolase